MVIIIIAVEIICGRLNKYLISNFIPTMYSIHLCTAHVPVDLFTLYPFFMSLDAAIRNNGHTHMTDDRGSTECTFLVHFSCSQSVSSFTSSSHFLSTL